MKVKRAARDDGVDTDFALAMALEEGGADSDDDFEVSGSSPAFLNQALALRSCAVRKRVKRRGSRENSRLEKRQRGEVGGDGADLEGRGCCRKEMKVHCDAGTEFVVGSRVGSTGSERRCMAEEAGKRVLKDHNSKSMGPAKMGSVVTSTIVLVKGDENGSNVRPGEVKKLSSLGTIGLEQKDGRESTDWRINSSLACDQTQQQGQSGYVLKFDSKRKTESGIHDTGWGLYSDGAKKVKKIAGFPEDVEESDQTEGNVGLDSWRFEVDEGVKSNLGAEVDEDMIICTQVEALSALEFGQSTGGRSGVADDMGKTTVEDRRTRRHNIYDILLGNNRTNRIPTCALNSTVEYDGGVEEMETLGTAMRALIEEAELAYDVFDFNEAENESIEPACGTELIDLSDSDEEHVGDCLENGNVPCSRTNSGDGLGREPDVTEAAEIAEQLSSQRTVTIEAMDCPVCGICIEELSTTEREEHTNACLEKGCVPCIRTNSGDLVGCQAESTEKAGISHLRTSRGSVIAVTLVCPVCGDCIEELSTAQREEHTNACLDKTKGEGPGEVAEPAKADLVQPQGRPAVGQVVTWLENLNLGKYVNIFVKEEIDWDTLKWLTEEDLSSLGITAFGPRKKIVCAIQELRTSAPTLQKGQRFSDPVIITSVDALQGSKKSISDFFIPPNTGPRFPVLDRNPLAGAKALGSSNTARGLVRNKGQKTPISGGGNLRSARTSDIPTWMCIPGTSFRVDAFKYTTGNCSNWFLTHFHTDHYQGLTRGFRHGRIFCSSITARLVNLRIGIPSDRIQALPLNETVLIDGVRVTFIDANHCPGSVMILFEPPNGKAVLHTGDFRFCPDMISNEVLKACRISTLILDTTYCDPQYDFPEQDSVVQFVIDAIQAEFPKWQRNDSTISEILRCTLTGKERIFLEVGKALQKYVYVGAAKQRLLDCMDLAEDDKRWLTTKDQESHIHVVPLWSVASFKRMGSISRHYHGRYNSIVAFSPTGWSFGKDKKRIQGRPGRRYQQGSIIRYEVPYSEHCSFTELKEFVRIVAPENIVPSVISSAGLTADAMVATLLGDESCCR